MSDRGDDIKATAEDIIQATEQLRYVEETKLQLPEGDPEIMKLSLKAANLARDIARETRLELEIAAEPDPTPA